MNILLVEDNESISKGLKYTLEKNEYKVITTSTKKETIEKINDSWNLIILDITLPDGNGFDIYKDYIETKKIPTIFLTAKDEEENIIKGLSFGVEDYITKPFSTNILIAKIKNILEKNKNDSIIKIDDITFNKDSLELKKEGKKIELTALELKILTLLFQNTNKVISRNTLLESIWEWTGNDVDDHTITVYIKRIKDKLGTDIIKTIKGIGYRIDEK